jgi:hypothetical protein
MTSIDLQSHNSFVASLMSLDTLFIQPNIVCCLLMNPVCTILSLWLVYKTIKSFRSGTHMVESLHYIWHTRPSKSSSKPGIYKANQIWFCIQASSQL